jgi:hypothetical protein
MFILYVFQFLTKAIYNLQAILSFFLHEFSFYQTFQSYKRGAQVLEFELKKYIKIKRNEDLLATK